jgi:hypothetical protein
MSREPELGEWIASLAEQSREDLCDHWRWVMKTEPPPKISQALLIKAVAYAMQEKRLGGLPSATRKRLMSIAKGGPISAGRTSPHVKSGTRLIRVWHGEAHEVLVTDQGYYWHGETHRSLSVIARTITGARWNGHRFFGLRAPGVGDG